MADHDQNNPDGTIGRDHEDAGRPSVVRGPTGRPMSLDDLPPPNTTRWVIRRKAEVVAAVEGGLLTLEEACRRYRLTREEFESWVQTYHQHGLQGLRTTRLQRYRADEPQSAPKAEAAE